MYNHFCTETKGIATIDHSANKSLKSTNFYDLNITAINSPILDRSRQSSKTPMNPMRSVVLQMSNDNIKLPVFY